MSNPCNNAGTCNVTSDGGYNCTCPQGFTGDICDQGVWTSKTMKDRNLYLSLVYNEFDCSSCSCGSVQLQLTTACLLWL